MARWTPIACALALSLPGFAVAAPDAGTKATLEISPALRARLRAARDARLTAAAGRDSTDAERQTASPKLLPRRHVVPLVPKPPHAVDPQPPTRGQRVKALTPEQAARAREGLQAFRRMHPKRRRQERADLINPSPHGHVYPDAGISLPPP